jgi:hypothetical protein
MMQLCRNSAVTLSRPAHVACILVLVACILDLSLITIDLCHHALFSLPPVLAYPSEQ